MKGTAVIFAALLACVVALPSSVVEQERELTPRDQRLVTDAVASAINDVRLAIREAGLDPLDIPRVEVEYALPVEGIFEARAYAEDVRSNGLSNIVINRLNFAVLSTRLTFEFELPRIEASLGDALAEIIVFGDSTYSARASGSLAIKNVVLAGEVRVSVGIISGISIRNLSLNFSLGGIESNLAVKILEHDISSELNTLLGTTVPNLLEKNEAKINELLELIVLGIVEEIL